MKIKNIILLLLTLSLPLFAQLDRSKKPAPKEAKALNIGECQTFTLSNGLKIFLVEDHRIPKVSFSLILNNDPILEKENAGFVSIAGELLRTGTTTKTKDEIDEAIDFIGASLSTSSDGLSGTALTKHVYTLLDILTDILYNSKFTEEELNKIKTQTISSIASAKDSPGSIAENINSKVNYGAEHPYGEISTEKSIKNITLEMCKNYYDSYFAPNRAYLAIVGDINRADAEKLVEKYFASWKKKDVPSIKYKTPLPPVGNKVYIADKPSAVQSNVQVTYPLELSLASKDFLAATVLNQILGGSATSRLFLNLREAKGFTYGAYSSIDSDELIGSFQAQTEVRTSVTDSAVTEIIAEMKRVINDKVETSELNTAKNYLMGNFSIALEQPSTIATFAMNIEKYNLPVDYYKNYLKNLSAITAEDVKTAAKKYIKPDKANIVIVGKADDISEKMKFFAADKQVTFCDSDANLIDMAANKVSENITAQSIIDGHLKAIGGKEKLEKVTARVMKLTGEVQGMKMTVEMTNKLPDQYLMLIDAGMMKQKVVCNSTKAEMEMMGQKQPIAGKDFEDMKINNNFNLLLDLAAHGVKAELKGLENYSSGKAYKVKMLMPTGSEAYYYFDSSNFYLVKQVTISDSPQGKMEQAFEFADFKDFNGIIYPYTLTQQMGPMKIEMKVTSIEINPKLDDAIFDIK